MSEKVKCKKCGFENPTNLKFCGNCGAKLGAIAEVPKFEGLALLHVTGSSYLLISLIFNPLVQVLVLTEIIFAIPYIASVLLGLYSSYEFYMGRISKYSRIISVLAIVLGLASTIFLFWIGLEILSGIIGPAWVIFLINAWMLLKERARLSAKA